MVQIYLSMTTVMITSSMILLTCLNTLLVPVTTEQITVSNLQTMEISTAISNTHPILTLNQVLMRIRIITIKIIKLATITNNRRRTPTTNNLINITTTTIKSLKHPTSRTTTTTTKATTSNTARNPAIQATSTTTTTTTTSRATITKTTKINKARITTIQITIKTTTITSIRVTVAMAISTLTTMEATNSTEFGFDLALYSTPFLH